MPSPTLPLAGPSAAAPAPARDAAWSYVVPVTTTGAGRPIWCLHAQTGNILIYQHFANAMRGLHPVYGLQALGNWGSQEPHESVEEMAGHYADEVLRAQPQGPYILFGMSMGGWMALELARLLTARGHVVKLLAMYDTHRPGFPRYTAWGRVVKFAREHGGISFGRLRKTFTVPPAKPGAAPKRFRALRAVLRNVLDTARWWLANTRRDWLSWKHERHNPPQGFVFPPNLTRFRLATRRISARYDPGPWSGKLTLFRAMQQPTGAVFNRTNGWDGVVAEIDVREMPGGHQDALFGTAAEELARTFRLCLAGPALPGDESYPLSPLQQGMLFHWLRAPNAGVDLDQVLCTLNGLDIDTFKRAWQSLTRRHAILRTRFRWHDVDVPVQVVARGAVLAFHEHDLRALSEAEQREQRESFLERDRREGFDLATAPLSRLTLYRTGDQTCEFVWTWHHVILDAQSVGILLQELMATYDALSAGREPDLAAPRPYRDFIVWQAQQDAGRATAFWKGALDGLTAPTFPEVGFTGVPAAAPEYAERETRLTRDDTAALNAFVAQHRITVNTMVQGAWALILSHYARADDVVFGATRNGRRSVLGGDPSVDRMVGLLINTLPVRVRIPAGQSVVAWLQQIRSDQVAVRDMEHSSLTDVQAASAIPASVPLFDTLLLFANERLATAYNAIDPRCTHFRIVEKTTYPITLHGYSEAELILRFEYYTARFDDASIARMLDQLTTVLRGMVANGDRPVREMQLLSPEARHQLVETWNQTACAYPSDRCAHEWIAGTAARDPARIAVEDATGAMSYGELDAAANRLARHLQQLGVGRGSLVAICLDRTRDLVVSLLATWKAGAAYVPLDPDYPEARVAAIVTDAAPALVITTTVLASRLPRTGVRVIRVDLERDAIAALDPAALPTAASPSDLAYVIFTSGSTGRPKGVQLEHRGLVNFLNSMRTRPGLGADDTLLAVTTISFDIAALELFLPLVVGARVVLAPRHVAIDGQALGQLLLQSGATMLQATPITWRILLEAGWTNPRRIAMLCGGEALPATLAAALVATGGALWNMYGPTETTIWSSVDAVTSGGTEGVIPIGGPIDNTTFYVLDTSMQPVPLGVAGELHIGGVGVARGYLDRLELTDERFVANPFGSARDPRLYKTGDLVRYRADGRLEFLGRIDHQVKVRGYRIELGEIESVLREHVAVQDAVVMAREDHPGMVRLVAYVQTAAGVAPLTDTWMALLSERLPDYMVPSAIVPLEHFPHTPNGKIDRKALPAPDLALTSTASVAPRDDIERRVLRIWEQVLGVTNIGVTDRFNAVGGHSLAAVQVFARIAREFGREIQLATILKRDTIAQLADLLRDPSQVEQWHCIVPLQTTGSRQPIFCAHAAMGNVNVYQRFAEAIGAEYPVYGIQALGNWGTQEPQESVEEMARYYIDHILEVQPQGPYVFFGLSMGGLIALELAQQMRERGSEVRMLAMYDSRAPGYPQYPWFNRVTRWLNERGGIPLWKFRWIFGVDRGTPRDVPNVVKSIKRRAGTVAYDWWRMIGRERLVRRFKDHNPPHGYPLPQIVTRVSLAAHRVAGRYEPRFYPGTLTYFRADVQNPGARHDPTNGWRGRSAELVVHAVPGGHEAAMREPGVTEFATRFRKCLDG